LLENLLVVLLRPDAGAKRNWKKLALGECRRLSGISIANVRPRTTDCGTLDLRGFGILDGCNNLQKAVYRA
jgi:hypothetical protein